MMATLRAADLLTNSHDDGGSKAPNSSSASAGSAAATAAPVAASPPPPLAIAAARQLAPRSSVSRPSMLPAVAMTAPPLFAPSMLPLKRVLDAHPLARTSMRKLQLKDVVQAPLWQATTFSNGIRTAS